jgi:hypothetical protein
LNWHAASGPFQAFQKLQNHRSALRGEAVKGLEPIQVQVVRVADSLGEIYFEDFIAN